MLLLALFCFFNVNKNEKKNLISIVLGLQEIRKQDQRFRSFFGKFYVQQKNSNLHFDIFDLNRIKAYVRFGS